MIDADYISFEVLKAMQPRKNSNGLDAMERDKLDKDRQTDRKEFCSKQDEGNCKLRYMWSSQMYLL
eukprot:12501045-Ditylum_brightwellii.AAC.1